MKMPNKGFLAIVAKARLSQNPDVSHKMKIKPHTTPYFAVLAVTMAARLSMAATLYVATNGAHVSPFSSWPNAATSINAAVSTAQSNDTVIVSNGTYKLNATVQIYKLLKLISANGPSNTIIDGQNQRGCLDVGVYPSTISGFTIRRGNSYVGGGIEIERGTITNCVVTGNTATYLGGGISMLGDRVTIRNCVVNSNNANGGGGISIEDAGTVLDCDLTGNTAMNGGGIFVSNRFSELIGTIANCNICSNNSSSKGGGVFAVNCRINIQDCVVISNRTSGKGGGVCIQDGGTILNCIVMGNTADNGAGIYLYDLNSGLIRNCLMAENQATNSPGSYQVGGGASVIGIVGVENCTIYNNSSKWAAGGLYFETLAGIDYSPTTRYTVVNTICYSNYAPSEWSTNCEIDRTDTTFAYCDISPAPAGIGNFDADPLLANVPVGDYSLGGCSPCVDAGPPYANYPWLYSGHDLSGTTRASGDSVDIGAYETSIAARDICNTGTIGTLWGVPVGAIVKLSSSTNLINPTWLDVGIFTSATHTISIPDANTEAIHKFYKLHWLRE